MTSKALCDIYNEKLNLIFKSNPLLVHELEKFQMEEIKKIYASTDFKNAINHEVIGNRKIKIININDDLVLDMYFAVRSNYTLEKKIGIYTNKSPLTLIKFNYELVFEKDDYTSYSDSFSYAAISSKTYDYFKVLKNCLLTLTSSGINWRNEETTQKDSLVIQYITNNIYLSYKDLFDQILLVYDYNLNLNPEVEAIYQLLKKIELQIDTVAK